MKTSPLSTSLSTERKERKRKGLGERVDCSLVDMLAVHVLIHPVHVQHSRGLYHIHIHNHNHVFIIIIIYSFACNSTTDTFSIPIRTLKTFITYKLTNSSTSILDTIPA